MLVRLSGKHQWVIRPDQAHHSIQRQFMSNLLTMIFSKRQLLLVGGFQYYVKMYIFNHHINCNRDYVLFYNEYSISVLHREIVFCLGCFWPVCVHEFRLPPRDPL